LQILPKDKHNENNVSIVSSSAFFELCQVFSSIDNKTAFIFLQATDFIRMPNTHAE
jgi:hypothetical protein